MRSARVGLGIARRWGRRYAGTCWCARGDATAGEWGFAGVGENCSAGGGGRAQVQVVSGALTEYYFWRLPGAPTALQWYKIPDSHQ